MDLNKLAELEEKMRRQRLLTEDLIDRAHQQADKLMEEVQMMRKRAGLLPYPFPPIRKPKRESNAMRLWLGWADDPAFLSLPIGEQDLRRAYACMWELTLDFLASPDFHRLKPSEQRDALFGKYYPDKTKWPWNDNPTL